MVNFLNALGAQADWAIFALRIAVGLIFIAHGAKKFKDFTESSQWFDRSGFKPGIAWNTIAAFTQLLGGLCILVGFATRAAAGILVIEMIIATLFNLKRKEPFFEVIELDILLLAALLALATLGDGFVALGNLF